MSAPGLQVGFGDPIGADVLKQVKAEGFKILRLDCQENSDAEVTALAQEVINEGLQPLVTVRRPEALRALPEGALAEFGNEADLLNHFGWPTFESYWTPCQQAIHIAIELDLRLYIGVVSNLNARGFAFLDRMPWPHIDPRICCAVHRYPEKGKGPTAPHSGYQSREAEVAKLRSIVGNRPISCSELGYHRGADAGYTEQQVSDHLVWERQFFTEHGFDFAVAYQINNGPEGDTSALGNYGLRRRDGTWLPAARAFTGVQVPPVIAEPPAVPPPAVVLPALQGVEVGFRIGSNFLCCEGGGGGVINGNRPKFGPWERFHVKKLDDKHVSIQASTGHYVAAELDGTTLADRPRPGQDPASLPDTWERWEVDIRGDKVAFKSAHGKYFCVEGGTGTVVANRPLPGQNPNDVPSDWELLTPTNWDWWQTTPFCKRPLVGPLRIQDKLFRDDTGYRRVFFCSWFTALRILRDNPKEFERQLDVITDAGYQGFRTFFAVGGWSTYWDGCEVVPVSFQKWFHSPSSGLHRPAALGSIMPAWTDYEDLLRRLLRACKARKLRLHQAVGDMQIIFPDKAGKSRELEFTRRVARICREEGGLEVMALVGDTNEYPQNHYGSDSPESIEQMGSIVRIWEDEIPGVLTTMGSAISEEPDQLYASITYGKVCAVHTSRGVPTALKRTHALVHWEGHYRQFTTPFWQGEPMGFGPEVSVDRFHRPCDAVALYAMHALTGQASNLFCGPAIHSKRPLEAEWGFYVLPSLFERYIPEDVATWPNQSNNVGGIAYWFKDKRFITATADDWNTDPPRPVATWTLHRGDSTESGTGTPPRKAGMITGEFS